MSERAYYEPKRASPTALTIVVLMHGAAIAALAMAKMEVIANPFSPTTVVNIEEQKPPPPEPPKPIEKVETPQHRSVIDRIPQIVPTPAPPNPVDLTPVPLPPLPYTPPAKVDLPPAPTPPPPKKMEPARARANLASYVSDADYPAAAIRNDEQGTTRFRLSVGPNGRVTECAITASSGSSALDAATCRIMKSRARFAPARDSDGNPTSDTVTSAIRWMLPDD